MKFDFLNFIVLDEFCNSIRFVYLWIEGSNPRTDTESRLKTNLLPEKTLPLNPSRARKRNKKKPKILPLQIPKLSLRILSNSNSWKKRKKRDSIKFSLPIPSILGPFVSSPLVDEIYLEYPSAIARRRGRKKCGQKPVTKTRWPRKIWGTILLTKRARGNKNRPLPPSSPAKTNKIGRFQRRRRQESE